LSHRSEAECSQTGSPAFADWGDLAGNWQRINCESGLRVPDSAAEGDAMATDYDTLRWDELASISDFCHGSIPVSGMPRHCARAGECGMSSGI
jgi:hypothetical protein